MNCHSHEIKVVSRTGKKAFDRDIQALWKAGWELHGEIKVNTNFNPASTWPQEEPVVTYTQVMVRTVPKMSETD